MALPVIILADINDTSKTSGVRGIGIRNNLIPIRTALRSDKIGGDSLRSFNKWTKTSSLNHDGVWIDEIFTRGMRLQDAGIRRTCTDIPYLAVNASDHNGLVVDAYIENLLARFHQINLRRSDLPELYSRRTWAKRKPYMIRYLRTVGASVIGVQECTKTQLQDVLAGLPPNWNYVGFDHNVRILFDGDVWDAVDGSFFQGVLASDLRKRYLTLVQLRHRGNGWMGLFGSLHLASGGLTERNAPALRLAQMQKVVEMITEHSEPVGV